MVLLNSLMSLSLIHILAELDRAGKQLGAVLFDLLFEQGNLFELTAQCKKVRFCVQLLGVQLLGKVRFQSSQLALQDLGILGQLGVLLLQLCAAGGRLLVAFGVLANLLGQPVSYTHLPGLSALSYRAALRGLFDHRQHRRQAVRRGDQRRCQTDSRVGRSAGRNLYFGFQRRFIRQDRRGLFLPLCPPGAALRKRCV